MIYSYIVNYYTFQNTSIFNNKRFDIFLALLVRNVGLFRTYSEVVHCLKCTSVTTDTDFTEYKIPHSR